MAADGVAALAMIAQTAFDLILLDVEMPGISGIEVLSTLRATHSRTELPVIMVTARTAGEDVVEALGFGAKLCIHPRQVAVVRHAFMPTAESIAWAERVVAAADAGGGAAQVDGAMVDKPVVERAKAVLALAQLSGSARGDA